MTFSIMTTLVLSSNFEINVLNEITTFLSVFHGHLCSNRIYQRS
jgi:hypothetical protein